MTKKMWKNIFDSSTMKILSIDSKEDVDDMINLFLLDKIDPQAFFANLETLFGVTTFSGLLEEKKQSTPSMDYCAKLHHRAPAFPLWFYAAYPDVMVWFHKWQKKHGRECHFDQDIMATDTAKLFGVNIEDKNIDYKQILDNNERYRPKYLSNLVKHYKNTTGKKLEVLEDEDSENDTYLGAELLDALGTESNFTLIAEITTKYYLELTKKYKNRFNDEISLLATAGILDAQHYIFIEQKIKPSEIIDIAKQSVKNNKEALINFIINLEIKIFIMENPEMAILDIKKACTGQKENIKQSIQKIRKEYTHEPLITKSASVFMNSPQFKSIRQLLGINKKKKKFLFF